MNAQTGKGDYIKIDYDICHGEFKGYYTKQNEKFGGNWFASFIRSYKESALGMFKHFISCVETSNVGYRWDWNERGLVGKYVGVVLGEEEYEKNSGDIGIRLVVKDIKTTEQIVRGDFEIPDIKKLERKNPSPSEVAFIPMSASDDLPFN